MNPFSLPSRFVPVTIGKPTVQLRSTGVLAMSLAPEKLLTPEEEELQRKQAALAGLEAQLADRELELAAFLAELVPFSTAVIKPLRKRRTTSGVLSC